MSFEYIINQNEKTKKLTQEEKEQLVSKISSKFVTLNSERSENLEMASNLANEIFFKNDFKSLTDKNQKWKAKIKMCKTFMFYQTLKAFIWRNTYANVNSMFDLSGENVIWYNSVKPIQCDEENDWTSAMKKAEQILKSEFLNG